MQINDAKILAYKGKQLDSSLKQPIVKSTIIQLIDT